MTRMAERAARGPASTLDTPPAMADGRPQELDAGGILRVLNRHGVRYVVIGGVAGILHGSGLTTQDLDVTAAQG